MSYGLTGYKLKQGDTIEILAHTMGFGDDEYQSEIFTSKDVSIIEEIIRRRYGVLSLTKECYYKEITINLSENQISFSMPYWEESLKLYDELMECIIEIHTKTGIVFWDCQEDTVITTFAPRPREMEKIVHNIPGIVKEMKESKNPWWKLW